MAEKRGQYVYNDDGTVSTLVSIAGAEDSGGGAVGTNLKSSQIMAPVDIQSRYATTIQTHSGAIVPPTTGSAGSAWIPCDGYDKVVFHLMNDAATNSRLDVQWSEDGVNLRSEDKSVLAASAERYRPSNALDVKFPYFRVYVNNTDASPHTMSAWAYLKA